MDKGMTARELIEKLEWGIENGYLKDEDYVFYLLPNEDEGDTSALRPVSNISAPSIQMFRNEEETIEGMLLKQPISLCFVKPIYFR